MRVRFWGTRGSIATPGPGTNYFGGNTSCVELTTSDGDLLIFDCGTGAHRLAAELMNQGKKAINSNILLGPGAAGRDHRQRHRRALRVPSVDC